MTIKTEGQKSSEQINTVKRAALDKDRHSVILNPSSKDEMLLFLWDDFMERKRGKHDSLSP